MLTLDDASEREQFLLRALALMCHQYIGEDINGHNVLDHMGMSAGEQAYEALSAYGLIEIEGRSGFWTEEGERLLDTPVNQMPFPK